MIWYKENVEQLFVELKTSDKGLTKSETISRLKKYGYNTLDIIKDSIWQIIFEPFKSAFIVVLALAAIVSLVSHEPLDAIIIGAIILINSVIFYTQHYATARVLRSLKKHNTQQVTVLRDEQEIAISSTELVPGDIIIINEGERIPADARVIHTHNLQVDESSLTGESLQVQKHSSTLTSTKQIYEQDNMVFQGTYVIAGTAKALVVETGVNTEFSKIAKLASDNNTKSPVQEKINQLVTLLIKAVVIICSLVFVLALARGIPTGEAVRFVLSMAVSAAPEGLPVALTVIIVLGMRRMAKHKALVRSFKAIEDIGLVTTIATDKTGTLTKNHLSIADSWQLNKESVLNIAPFTVNTESKAKDTLDIAISEYSQKPTLHKVDKYFPFDLKVRMSGAFIAKNAKIYIKGSPEHVISKSNLSTNEHHLAESKMHEMTSKGHRVIAFGEVSVNKPPDSLDKINNHIKFIGFIAFADKLRPEAKDAIANAKLAGISVRMITGDHYETAFNIGKQIGLANHPNQVIQGTQLPQNQQALAQAINTKTVFARILPEDKFKILKALKQNEITAMTGDGVNDVPALSNAHVGIAMGSGSDIARDAGGIVLLDDNFATIVKAISEGRKIFDNIRRMLFYLLSTSLGEVMTMLGALILGLPLPVAAIQILWINLVTDTAMVLPLGLEPEEDGHMKRPPRKPKDPLLNKILLTRMVLVALTMAVTTLFIVYTLSNQGQSTAYIQTVAFMSLISAQWVNAFNARSEYKSSFSRLNKMNYGLLVGLSFAIIAQYLVMFGPLKSVFNIVDIPLNVLIKSSSLTMLAVLIVSELHKLIVRLNSKDSSNIS
jgi:Ca2+-transporting ATPase